MLYATPPQIHNTNGAGYAPPGQVRHWYDSRSYAMADSKIKSMFPGSKMTEMFHDKYGQPTKAYVNDGNGQTKTVSFDGNQHVSRIQEGCR